MIALEPTLFASFARSWAEQESVLQRRRSSFTACIYTRRRRDPKLIRSRQRAFTTIRVSPLGWYRTKTCNRLQLVTRLHMQIHRPEQAGRAWPDERCWRQINLDLEVHLLKLWFLQYTANRMMHLMPHQQPTSTWKHDTRIACFPKKGKSHLLQRICSKFDLSQVRDDEITVGTKTKHPRGQSLAMAQQKCLKTRKFRTCCRAWLALGDNVPPYHITTSTMVLKFCIVVFHDNLT